VVEDAAVEFRRSGVLPEAHALLAGVVHDQIDELAIGAVRLEGVVGVGHGVGMGDLEAPIDRERPVHVEVAVDRGPCARVLPHHDRVGARPRQRSVDPSDVHAASQPDRVAGLHRAAPTRECGRQIPGAPAAAVPTRPPARGRRGVEHWARGAVRVPEDEQRRQSGPPRGRRQWNSKAPMSYAAPCGRLVPRKSLVTYERVTPASMAGPPACSAKLNVDASTNFGSVLSRLLDKVTPVPFPSAAVPPAVRLFSTVTLLVVPPSNKTPAVRGW